MDETLSSLRCLAPLPMGQLCNQPAVLLDCQTLRPFCLAHTQSLTDEQRALVTKVLGLMDRELQRPGVP